MKEEFLKIMTNLLGSDYDDFIKYGSLQKVKEAGKFRLAGKEYVFQDGDMTIFRFNL